MIFSSVPVYLDPPNWQQPPDDHHLRNENLNEIASFPQPQRPPSSSTRPGSMADRARLAKMPQPEVQLKCPRCESSNTKFCYYNNYNLSQPRHFCKTCRRYWTQGGALRNVPVGGGCRRNKKNKSKSSKSSLERPTTSNLSSGSGSIPSGSSTREMINHFQQNPNQFPFISSLPSFSRYGVGALGGPSNFNEIQLQSEIEGVDHQWRPQQFPFLGGFESTGLYPYQNDGVEAPSSAAEATHLQETTLNTRATQFPPVKIEESQMLNLTRGPSLEVLNNSQIYGANAWTDLSGLSSSSTSHFF